MDCSVPVVTLSAPDSSTMGNAGSSCSTVTVMGPPSPSHPPPYFLDAL